MSKKDILLENGTYNRNYDKVTEQRFINDDFFDPRDLVQVKYEMLRAVRESGRSVEETADKFGFSRSGFYKIKAAFEEEGVSALVPHKSGPQNARKLTEEYQQFIDNYLLENPGVSSKTIAIMLKTERGFEISKRTIERYRNRRHY